MTRVTYVGSAPLWRGRAYGGVTVRSGETIDRDEDVAKGLVENFDFEYAEDTDLRPDSNSVDETGGASMAGPDVGEWPDWSEDDWYELDYNERAADIREGRVDNHLDEIIATETSETAEQAARDRRDELNATEE